MMLKSFSPAVNHFIRQLLIKDPAKRLGHRSADEIKRHAFLQGTMVMVLTYIN